MESNLVIGSVWTNLGWIDTPCEGVTATITSIKDYFGRIIVHATDRLGSFSMSKAEWLDNYRPLD